MPSIDRHATRPRVQQQLLRLKRGEASWGALLGDCRSHLRAIPDDTFDFVLTSPPYENRRYYSCNFKLRGQAWVDWLFPICLELARVCKGLVIVNCQGETDDYRYSAVPLLLGADLHRAGMFLRCPPIYYRHGISGSGGPDYLRNDYEFCLAFSKRRGKLPYSNNTACGHPPKYAPGGAMSHRVPKGKRINEWGSTPHTSNGRKPNGEFKRRSQKEPTAFQKFGTPRRPNASRQLQAYKPPKVANPGNVINRALYTAEDVAYLLSEVYGVPGFGDMLHCLVGGGVMGDHHAHKSVAPMALDLADFFVRTFCPPAGLAYDPFGGSGTTAKACLLAGRKCLLSEIDPAMIAVQQERLAGCSELAFESMRNALVRWDQSKEDPRRIADTLARRIFEEGLHGYEAILSGPPLPERDRGKKGSDVPGPLGPGANESAGGDRGGRAQAKRQVAARGALPGADERDDRPRRHGRRRRAKKGG